MLGKFWHIISKWAVDKLPPKPKPMPVNPKEKYKDIYLPDATFPDDPYRKVSVRLNATVSGVYIPALDRALPNAPKGLKTLLIAMTHQEGFYPKSRSFRTNNPGNVGNTDSGANKGFPTLEDGIRHQAQHLQDIAAGKKKNYPLGKVVDIKPFFSKEIANNPQYGLPPYLPGYKFTYTGQLNQFLKIYSTGARVTNSYINVVTSYFAQNGLTITPESKLQDIIQMG